MASKSLILKVLLLPPSKNNELRITICQLNKIHTHYDDCRALKLKLSNRTLWRHFTFFFKILENWTSTVYFIEVSVLFFISAPKTFCVVELISKFRNFRYIRYFNGQLCNGRPKYGHIRHQRFQINLKQCFVFQFLQILVLTVFPFFRRPFWIEDMNRKRWFAIPYKAMSWRT